MDNNTQFNKFSKDGRNKNNPTFDRDRNNKDNKSFEKKPFVPRDNNGYKPQPVKPEIVEVVTKPERNFGNKNKTPERSDSKKQMSKKDLLKKG